MGRVHGSRIPWVVTHGSRSVDDGSKPLENLREVGVSHQVRPRYVDGDGPKSLRPATEPRRLVGRVRVQQSEEMSPEEARPCYGANFVTTTSVYQTIAKQQLQEQFTTLQ